jgi:hypothetical protein
MKLNWSLLAVAAAFAFGVDAVLYEVDPDFSIGARLPYVIVDPFLALLVSPFSVGY